MYHEVTDSQRKKRRARAIVACVVCVCLLALAVIGINHIRLSSREQGAAAIRRSIMDAAIRCCAIEGSYPLSLSHLENSYGLRINHKDYIITYEAYASNMAPSVVVVPR